MLCKVCNTRVAPENSMCPNCGSAVGSLGLSSPAEDAVLNSPIPGRRARTHAPDVETDPEISLDTEAIDPHEEPEVDETKPDVPIRIEARNAESKLRALLADRPESLEPGLTIHQDASGTSLGIGYRCEVGEIDLLGRDESGAFVVVLIADPNEGESAVREILNRIGWVRKRLANGGERVRGLVLLDRVPENLSYLASAVADTVSFKTYRVTLRFDDIEV
jgi:hypothetical protein